jgi:hypothetical protein
MAFNLTYFALVTDIERRTLAVIGFESGEERDEWWRHGASDIYGDDLLCSLIDSTDERVAEAESRGDVQLYAAPSSWHDC